MKGEGSPRLEHLGHWRAGVLGGVYVLMGLHIAHWRLSGRTLAPLELNEVMYTLELGIVTAGFIFMAVAVLSAAIFGRFFCSWGCHILALEDLCAWILARLKIRPRPVRSRLLLLVAPSAMAYMFIWPQVARVLRGDSLPELRLLSDGEGWASFVTTDYWRNLPGPWVALVTFAICGFAIVYVLGSRSFCRYACPYGAIFALADRIAPGRLVAAGDCSRCGICTARCKSNIRVHEELTVFGKVVSPSCLKDLDCLRACPDQAITYRFTTPSFFSSWRRAGRRLVGYDFALAEEALMAAVFLATLFVYRGLYASIPFLMTLGLGGILAYGAVLSVRLVGAPNVRLNNFQLKLGGRITRAGKAFAAAAVALVAVTIHSAFVRCHEFLGHRAYQRVSAAAARGALRPGDRDLASAIGHLRLCDRFGFYRPEVLLARLATLHVLAGAPEPARPYLDRLAARDPGAAHELQARTSALRGDAEGAAASWRAALEHDPGRIAAHQALGEYHAARGQFAEAAEHMGAVVEAQPGSARDRYNLAVVLVQLERIDEALVEYQAAVHLAPRDAEVRNNLGLLLAQRGDLARAEEHLREAIEIAPGFAHPYFNLGRVLLARGQVADAQAPLRRAAELDPMYAELLRGPDARR